LVYDVDIDIDIKDIDRIKKCMCVINLDCMKNLLIINLSFFACVYVLFYICDDRVIHENM